ncbi:hypothetical protein NC652_040214 [Populus alba x Populus x berolinensis]|nr:hypothetical protein NC652_040214 [Populus alba x Populus x berolinensis]
MERDESISRVGSWSPLGLEARNILLTHTVHAEEHEQNINIDENPNEVSIKLLACFNKPELPVLLFGIIDAVIQGIVTPISSFFAMESLWDVP